MGPNGSGKSTLAGVLAGRDGYEVTAGHRHATKARDLLALDARRARARGRVPRVPVPGRDSGRQQRLPAEGRAQRDAQASRRSRSSTRSSSWRWCASKMKLMHMDESFLNRGVNEGFSGGEKKRNEILQMAVLEPTLAMLDETDSGLDIDALRVVANGVNSLRSPGSRDRAGHALPAPARLHRARPRARAVGRPHPAKRRQVARARARAARLRLGASRRRRSHERHAPPAIRVGRLRAQLDARCRRLQPATARGAQRRSTRFAELGFPARRDEDWKYTNLRRLESRVVRAGRRATARQRLAAGCRRRSTRAASCSSTAIVRDGALRRSGRDGGLRRLRSLGAMPSATRAAALRCARYRAAAPSASSRLNAAFCDATPLLLDVAADASSDADLHVRLRRDRRRGRACASARRGCDWRRAAASALRARALRRAMARRALRQRRRRRRRSARAPTLEHLSAAAARRAHASTSSASTPASQRDGRYASRDASLGGTLARLDLRRRV